MGWGRWGGEGAWQRAVRQPGSDGAPLVGRECDE